MIFSGLAVPVRALIIGALGAGIAWSWYNGQRWLSFVAPVAVAAVGLSVSALGVSRLPRDPVTAVRLMPWRVLVPSVVAAAAAGLVIIVTVELTLPEKTAAGAPTPTDLKEVVTALSSAITAFLGAAFIDWAGDGKDSRLADWISSTFRKKYKGVFPPDTDGANFVYSSYTVDGWGPAARMTRAKGIVAALSQKSST
jgi:hypothetical protein